MVTFPASTATRPPAAGRIAEPFDGETGVEESTPVTGTALTRVRPQATAMLFMRAGRPHEPVAVPQVLLGAGDLLVEVEFATVCGSDVHTVQGHRVEPAPAVLGHEAVGRVTAIGGVVPALDGVPLVPGDRVVWSVTAPCSTCDACRAGTPDSCRSPRKYGHERIGQGWELTGGFATHVHLRAGTAVARVDESIPASVLAPAGCGISTAWAALAAAERSNPLAGATVLVAGAGLIGLAGTAMAHERGATVIVSEPNEDRRRLAHRFGAAVTIDPNAGESPRSVLGGRKLRGRHDINIAIEASGSAFAVSTVIDAVASAGTVVLVGSVFPTEPVMLLPERVVRSQLTITGVHNYRSLHLQEALQFLSDHWRAYPFEQFVGRIYPLDALDEALDRAGRHREVRVGVAPTGSTRR